MSSFALPRAAPSLPANETTPLSPKYSQRDPTKTFSKIMGHLILGYDNSSHQHETSKEHPVRPIQIINTSSKNTPRTSLSEDRKTVSIPPSPTSKLHPKSNTHKHQRSNSSKEPIYAPTAQTQYMDMLLGLDEVPRAHNLLASFSTWILLAGYIVVPGTFVSIEKSQALRDGAKNNVIEHSILDGVKHASLIWVASLCCAVGATGMIWLWWRWRHNYVWLINKIFLVGLLNSLAGLISTLINVYSQQKGRFSITATITTTVTASCTAILAVLYVLYNFWILQGVRRRHEAELELESQKRAAEYKLSDSE